MKALSFILGLSLFGTLTAAAQSANLNTIEKIAARCTPGAQAIYTKDFRWGYELPEMMVKFAEMYGSPKRLANNAIYDVQSKTLRLPYDASRGGDVVVDETFIQTVARHIEEGFRQKVVDAVFFPDMGHSHLLIPENLMKEKYDNYPIDQMAQMYSEMLKEKEIKILYHTAEQLKMLDSNNKVLEKPHIQFRHKTRNLVGENHPQAQISFLQNPESAANTVSGASGYYWWGAGFNLSANKDGCFAYQVDAKVYYFDISMFDLLYEDEAGDGW